MLKKGYSHTSIPPPCVFMADYRLTMRDERGRRSHPNVPIRLGLTNRAVIQQNNICGMQGINVQ
jgi:hypothetical protein